MSTRGNNDIKMMANAVWSSIFSIPLLKNRAMEAHCIQIMKFIRHITEDKISWSIWQKLPSSLCYFFIELEVLELKAGPYTLFVGTCSTTKSHSWVFIYFHHKFSSLIPKNQNLYIFFSIDALNTPKYFFTKQDHYIFGNGENVILLEIIFL